MILTPLCWRAGEGGTKREEKQIEIISIHVPKRAQKERLGPPGRAKKGRGGAKWAPGSAGRATEGRQRGAGRAEKSSERQERGRNHELF